MVGLELDNGVSVLQLLDVALTDDRGAEHVGDGPQNVEFSRLPLSLRRAVVKTNAAPNLAVDDYRNNKVRPDSPS